LLDDFFLQNGDIVQILFIVAIIAGLAITLVFGILTVSQDLFAGVAYPPLISPEDSAPQASSDETDLTGETDSTIETMVSG
jgi:hypothetical protein